MDFLLEALPLQQCMKNAAQSCIGRHNCSMFRMKALLVACKPLILLDFHRSFNDTRTKKVLFSCENSTFSFKGKNIIEDELQFRQGSVPLLLLHDTAAPSIARGGSVLIQFQSQALNMISPTVCGFQ